MADGRMPLPAGTIIELDKGEVYRITGEPIGFGGGSILYPARRQNRQQDAVQTDEIQYVLKECYPVSMNRSFARNEYGAIVPRDGNCDDMHYLQRAQLLQLEEGAVSQRIYRTASRMLPIRSCSQTVSVTLPGQAAAAVPNTVTVMDSLAEKGRSLTAWVKERKRFTPAETFRIIQQLLFALREVHRAGYLHLDIQDGNVFLKGTLEDQDELVTLIDFGCAREMTAGKTAPVHDRVIFTTQGFSAPEILLHNDGTLQLGPETDIFSVGCLIYYLLTGLRADVRELIENRTGVYLRPNQLRRIRCPKHLVESMQHILAMSLAKEPKNRYRSVDAMLADVTVLADALQPRRPVLSSVRYDAFVCYKHGQTDSAAALALQRLLENYTAPQGVSEKRKPFSRVFVDEGELSSCADFGQQIREALKNSGWLIVICSPDTPLSPWVQLEIDTFLEYHDRSRILAVLTGGSPETSFPPQLKGNSASAGEVFAAHAIGNTPADAVKQLKGDALLKIAAPMLGTTYDTLKQRHKIYQLQKFAAITAGFLLAAVGFAAYAVNRANVIADQAVRIEAEYERALINESLFLAEQAQKQLNSNDPLGAMELALQALPSREQNRPVVTEAVYVLGKALGVYTTPGSMHDTVSAVGKIVTDKEQFRLDETGQYLLIWAEYGGSLEVWDSRSMTLVRELFTDNLYHNLEFVFTGEHTIAVKYGEEIICTDFLTGVEKWRTEIKDLRWLHISQDRKSLITLSRAHAGMSEADAGILTLDVWSVSTGDPMKQISLRIDEKLDADTDICFSEDLKTAAITLYDSYSMSDQLCPYAYLYLADLESGEMKLLQEGRMRTYSMQFLGNQLAVFRGDGFSLTTMQEKTVYHYVARNHHWMELYDVETGTRKWSHEEFVFPKLFGKSMVQQTVYNTGSGEKTGLLFLYGDQCVLLDVSTGEAAGKYQLSDAVADIRFTDNGFETVNTNGTCSSVSYAVDYDSNIIAHRQYWQDVVSAAVRNGDLFYIQSDLNFSGDRTITKYQMNKYDNGYAPLWNADGFSWDVYRCDMAEHGQILLVKDRSICVVSSDGTSRIHTIPEAYNLDFNQNILGLSDDGTGIYLSERDYGDDSLWINHSRYYVLDLASGEISPVSMPSAPEPHLNANECVWARDTLFFTTTHPALDEEGNWTSDEYICVYAWNLKDGTLTELYRTYNVWEESIYGFGSLNVDMENQRLSLAFDSHASKAPGKIIRIDLQHHESHTVSLEFPGQQNDTEFSWYNNPLLWDAAGSTVYFVYDDTLYAIGENGEVRFRILLDESTSDIDLVLNNEVLLVLSQRSVLTGYRASDGKVLGTLDLSAYNTLSLSDLELTKEKIIQIDSTTLLLISRAQGFLLTITGDGMKMTAVIDHCIGCDAQNRFVVGDMDDASQEIGTIPHYSLEELIQKGNSVLGR